MNHKKVVVAFSAVAILATLLPMLSHVAGQDPESEDTQLERVRVRSARANLRLAEIESKIASTVNEQIPNLYSPQTVQRLRNHVSHAKEVLRYEMEGGEHGLHDLHLRELEVELEVAESELASGLKFNRRLPGSISDLEIEKLRVATDVARLDLELARDPAVMHSREEHLQWQVDRMRSEMIRLHVLMDKALARN